jgi:YihY family inner membrane protein
VLGRLRNAVDGFQQRHEPFAFVYGVVKKLGEDRAGQQAALLAYYGFFSLFPLLLLAVTVLGIVLRNNPDLQGRILDSALASFPIIGTEIRKNIHGIAKSGAGLVIGVAGALWGGLGGLKALQNAMDTVWNVPIRKQANTIRQIVRALMMLGVLGAFAIVSTGLAAFGTATSRFAIAGRLLTLLLSAAVNVGLFLLVFKILTVAEVTWRDVAPGAVVSGVGWTLLLALGNYLVGRQLTHASELYGFFGIVLGLLSWMYLSAQIVALGAEVNVVLKTRAWPRSLSSDNLTETDKRVRARQTEAEERMDRENVDVSFDRSAMAPSDEQVS